MLRFRICVLHLLEPLYFLLQLAVQPVCDRSLPVWVDVVRIVVAVGNIAVRECSRLVVPLDEAAVGYAGQRILPEVGGVAGVCAVLLPGVLVEPLDGLAIVAEAEIGISYIIWYEISFRSSVQSGDVVERLGHRDSIGIVAVPIVGFREPIFRQLIERVVAVGIERNRLKARHSGTQGTGRKKLLCPQIVGFHIVALHVVVQLVDFVVGFHSSRIVTVIKGSKCDIAIDSVTFREFRILLYIAVEN